MRVQVLPNGDLIANAVPVVMLLSCAYDVPANPSPLLSSLPDWTVRETYDIEGKAPANAIPPRLQDSGSPRRIQQMIRGLLADRFGLVMRAENKSMSVYALTVASGGPKLQKSAITEKDCIFDSAPQGCRNFRPSPECESNRYSPNHKESRARQTLWSTDDDVIGLIEALARQMPDKSIAAVLNRSRKQTGHGNSWTRMRVCSVRNQKGIRLIRGERQARGGWHVQPTSDSPP